MCDSARTQQHQVELAAALQLSRCVCAYVSHRVEVFNIDKDQRAAAAAAAATAATVLRVAGRETAAARGGLNTERTTGTDKDCVAQHPVTVGGGGVGQRGRKTMTILR